MRQLKRAGASRNQPPSDLSIWKRIIEATSAAYYAADRDRYLTDRSLEISSRELRQIHDRIQQQTLSQLAAARSLAIQLDRERARLIDAESIARVGSWETNLASMTVIWSAETFRIFEVDPARFLPTHAAFLECVHPADVQDVDQAFRASFHGHGISIIEHRLLLPDGRVKTVLERWRVLHDDDGRPMTAVGTCQDITERKQDEETLRNKDAELRALVEALPQLIWMTTPDGSNLYANQFWAEYTGLSRAQSLGDGWNRPLHPDDRERGAQAWRQAIETRTVYSAEYRLRRADGVYRWWLVRGAPLIGPDGQVLKWLGTCTDIHDLKEAEQVLRSSVEEKQALLREIHHRVKNNLQVIASLLRLEERRSAEVKTAGALRNMQGRIQAMATLHETLYRSGTFATVNLGAYLQQVATRAFLAFGGPSLGVKLNLDLAAVEMEMEQIIPCGLLVNELISNSLKHGFPHPHQGEVRVELSQPSGEAMVYLKVSDSGIGLPADFEHRRLESLGLQLASDLARQLSGKLIISSGRPAEFSVVFAPRLSASVTGSGDKAI